MSASTLAGARMKYSETEAKLSFESFPWSGVTKVYKIFLINFLFVWFFFYNEFFFLYIFQTYCVDSQVPDSACAATAILTGKLWGEFYDFFFIRSFNFFFI